MAGLEATALLEAISEAVYVVDRGRKIVYWNQAAEELTGFRADDVLGRPCSQEILNHVDENGKSLCRSVCPLAASMLAGQPRQAPLFLHHRDGHRVPVAIRTGAVRGPDGTITGGVEVFHDDSAFRKLANRLSQVEGEALTDELTGLPNRRLLERVLRQHHDDFCRYGHGYAVLFADIDNFKGFNDRYGHDVGDRVLKMVANTLRGSMRGGDTVGRWGGEEFLIVARAADKREATRIAKRAQRLVASAWTGHDAGRLRVTVAIGVAFARPRELTAELVRRADVQMLAAKKRAHHRSAVA
jgi:diguanylate cyclase (GGDEF)-like protein/PAS domain S-box-containing protein